MVSPAASWGWRNRARTEMSEVDLFGHSAPQADLFAGAPLQPVKEMDYPAEARAQLHRVLAEARAAATLPWRERDLRMWEILFPQMAGWLPGDEADQLCFAFERELERLKQAA